MLLGDVWAPFRSYRSVFEHLKVPERSIQHTVLPEGFLPRIIFMCLLPVLHCWGIWAQRERLTNFTHEVPRPRGDSRPHVRHAPGCAGAKDQEYGGGFRLMGMWGPRSKGSLLFGGLH